MATHSLYHGGSRQSLFSGTGVNSAQPVNWSAITAAAQKNHNAFAISWSLAPARYDRGPFAEKDGYNNQKAYFEQNTLAAGDVIEAILLPPFCVVEYLFYRSEVAITGLDFQLEIEDYESALSTPLDNILMGGAPFADIDGTLDPLPTTAPPRFIGRDGGIVRLNVTNVPGTLNMSCVRLGLSAAIRLFDRGDMIVDTPYDCS